MVVKALKIYFKKALPSFCILLSENKNIPVSLLVGANLDGPIGLKLKLKLVWSAVFSYKYWFYDVNDTSFNNSL